MNTHYMYECAMHCWLCAVVFRVVFHVILRRKLLVS